MQIYINMYTNIHAYVCKIGSMHKSIDIYVYVYSYICKYTQICIQIYMHMFVTLKQCTKVSICNCAGPCIYVHTLYIDLRYICVYSYICIHIYIMYTCVWIYANVYLRDCRSICNCAGAKLRRTGWSASKTCRWKYLYMYLYI